MKILDFELKGNVIKFYLGNCNDWWGDDWDDRPYEHNAGKVYEKYVENTIQIAIPMEYDVIEPASDWSYNGNSPFSKEDMQKRNCPCLIIAETNFFNQYSRLLSNKDAIKIFFGDNEDLTLKKLKKIKAVQLGEQE